jgi:transcription initiation factor TFIIB
MVTVNEIRERYRSFMNQSDLPLIQGDFVCCKEMNLVEDGEIYCNSCYTVHSPSIDKKPERRAFGKTEELHRVRTAPLDKYSHNYINTKWKDTRGRALTAKEKKKYDDLNKTQLWMQKATNKTILGGRAYISQLCGQLRFSDTIKNESSKLFEKIVEDYILKGRSIETLGAAVVYRMCNVYGIGIKPEVIAEAGGCTKKKVMKAYNVILNNYKLKSLPQTPESHIPRIISELGLPPKVETTSYKLLELAKKHRIGWGKSPSGLAAGVVYYATNLEGEKKTQAEVAKSAKTTEVTLRSRYKDLMEITKII